MLSSIQFFYYIKFVNYPWPSIISKSLDYYSLITLQEEPGYVRDMISTKDLEKYQVKGGAFGDNGVSSFLLINIEATAALFLTGLAVFLVLTVVKMILLSRKDVK